jgi:branched-chain amino acid transport system permease protein
MVQHHLRRRYELHWARLAGPYALGALGGALMVAGVVFVTESVAILFGEQYAVLRRTMGGGFPPYEAFGVSWSPTSPVTWILPAALLAVGLFVIIRVGGPIAEVWEGSRHKEPEDPTAMPNATEIRA